MPAHASFFALGQSGAQARLVAGTRRGGRHAGRVNTAHPNRLVAEAIAAGAIAELTGMRDEARGRYGKNSRIDMLLTGARAPMRTSRSRTSTCRGGRHAPSFRTR